ncbi:MAG: hypothetical protein HY763_08090 [Planctomycetes bacterium]|nr:hypothetical protein [Planctomycetota bacterium]
MIAKRTTFFRAFSGFALASLVLAGVLAAAGAVPTLRVVGRSGLSALVAGCLVSWLASCAGAVPVARAIAWDPLHAVNSMLAATMTRFLTVLVLIVPAVFSGWWDRTVLVFAAAGSYVVLLAADTGFALSMIKRRRAALGG